MKGTEEILFDREQSGQRIYESAEFFQDLGPYLDLSLHDFFNFVKNIPYKEDKKGLELTSRPKYLIHRRYNFEGLDCKKKAILMGAWFNAHNIPWKLVAVSEDPQADIHHVFVQAYLNGEWKNIDPTFHYFELFEPKPNVSHGEFLLR